MPANHHSRVIAHLFPKQNIPADQLERLRRQLSATCAAQSRMRVDIIVDPGDAKLDPAEHKSLRRIARGDADGVMLMQVPLTMTPRQGARRTALAPGRPRAIFIRRRAG